MPKPGKLKRLPSLAGSAADVSLRVGDRVALDASVTSEGLLAAGAMVSGILLSVAVLAFAAGRGRPSPMAMARRIGSVGTEEHGLA